MPGPYPDVSELPEFRYVSLKDTPLVDENGATRQVDDFAPRPNVKTLFRNGEMSLHEDHNSTIDDFSTKYIVSHALVVNYLTHLTNINEWQPSVKEKGITLDQPGIRRLTKTMIDRGNITMEHCQNKL